MLIKLETVVIIVGAGPAGAGTSMFLTKSGIDHIILEKDSFPRDKVCGDACSGKTSLVIKRANPKWYDEVFEHSEKFMPSHGLIFIAPNGNPLRIPFKPPVDSPNQTPGFTAKRIIFDHFLFSKLPSQHNVIYQGITITEITKHADYVSVLFNKGDDQFEVSAKIIVGADGDKGIVRKTFLNDQINPKAYAVGLRAYYNGVTGLSRNGFIELHFLPELKPGYFWIFPLPNGTANVGVGILSDKIRKNKINLRQQMLNAIHSNPTIKHRFEKAQLDGKIQGWGLPMNMQRSPLSGDNYILTGDAANLIDPFSGEGIGNALYSGMLAAGAIERALRNQNFSGKFLQQEYDDILYRRLGQEFKISATLQKLSNFPWLFNFVVNKAAKSKTLSKTISSMFIDMDLRSQLRKPSFYFKILFNR